jgi:transcription elongation GreA/GreB family factor
MKEKEELYTYCITYVQERISRLKSEIKKTQSSANEETKSSAGDKYETGRTMAQLEIEKNTAQLAEAERLMNTLNAIVSGNISGLVIPGSLITTDNGMFYIAVSIGQVTIDHKNYFVISSDSPIGKMFMGMKLGDAIEWNKSKYIIKSIE